MKRLSGRKVSAWILGMIIIVFFFIFEKLKNPTASSWPYLIIAMVNNFQFVFINSIDKLIRILRTFIELKQSFKEDVRISVQGGEGEDM